MISSFRNHWPEYLIEGCLLGAFMISAATFTSLTGGRAVYCAKLHHHNGERCIFRCAFGELIRRETGQR